MTHVKVCARCGDNFEATKRDKNIWCSSCAGATKDDRLIALIYADRSGLHGLYETPDQALAALKVDAEATGMSRLRMAKVVGQAGARTELRDDVSDDWMWERRERAWSQADYESETG